MAHLGYDCFTGIAVKQPEVFVQLSTTETDWGPRDHHCTAKMHAYVKDAGGREEPLAEEGRRYPGRRQQQPDRFDSTPYTWQQLSPQQRKRRKAEARKKPRARQEPGSPEREQPAAPGLLEFDPEALD